MKYSFTNYVKFRENLGLGMSPAETLAMQIIRKMDLHGATDEVREEALRYLSSPEGMQMISRLVPGTGHDAGDTVQDVLQIIQSELGR
jgi:hypothetical protein